jgi:hypothetical protein
VVAAEEATAEVRLEVTLTPDGEHTAGVLLVTLTDGSSSERRVRDASCEAAASSLAVMGALVLDARLPAVGAGGADAAEPVATGTPGPPASAPSATADRRSVAAPRPAPPARHREPHVSVRAHALWESGVAPGGALGALAGGGLAWPRAGVLSPAVGASLLATLGRRETASAGAATFHLVALRLTGCALELGLPLDGSLRLCAELDAGALRGEADVDVLNHGARTMPWLAGGLALRAGVRLPAGLAVEADAAGRALARHDRFVFRPGQPVNDVPPWSVGLSLGLSYRF